MNAPRNHGFALVTALVFLVVLTLVAITAIRSSGLELRMGANSALRTESFEASDSPRSIAGDVLDVHVYNRGWPKVIGGSVPNADFDYVIPTGFTIESESGVPIDWYIDNSGDTCTAPLNCDLKKDAEYARDVDGSSTREFWVRSSLSVFRLRADLSPGAGSAMVAGYEGAGKAAAAGGGRVFFYLRSVGKDANPDTTKAESVAETGAMFRHVIRN